MYYQIQEQLNRLTDSLMLKTKEASNNELRLDKKFQGRTA